MDVKDLIKEMRFQMDMLGAEYMNSCITLNDGCQVNISIYNKPDIEEQEEEN